eukprot:COSAG06_NODE_2407_length_6929_cov_2.622108_2_plen_56_part_00
MQTDRRQTGQTDRQDTQETDRRQTGDRQDRQERDGLPAVRVLYCTVGTAVQPYVQ